MSKLNNCKFFCFFSNSRPCHQGFIQHSITPEFGCLDLVYGDPDDTDKDTRLQEPKNIVRL